ncbi:MAG: Plug domain-containing protein [Gemmatimonadales bacterium]|nr:Plug domain-containing protein [Gemmatimonadales bacterium]
MRADGRWKTEVLIGAVGKGGMMIARLVLSAVVASCAGALTVGACGSPRERDAARPSQLSGQYVTVEEIRASGAGSAWEALKFTVRTHRFTDYRGVPTRIQSDRGQGSLVLREDPLVFLDGARLTDLTVLRMIPANNLHSIQVLTGPDATTYYGTSAVAGVILLETTLGAEEEDTVAVPDTTGMRHRAVP